MLFFMIHIMLLLIFIMWGEYYCVYYAVLYWLRLAKANIHRSAQTLESLIECLDPCPATKNSVSNDHGTWVELLQNESTCPIFTALGARLPAV